MRYEIRDRVRLANISYLVSRHSYLNLIGGSMNESCMTGLRPEEWVVLKDLHYSMIIRHRLTGEVRVVKK